MSEMFTEPPLATVTDLNERRRQKRVDYGEVLGEESAILQLLETEELIDKQTDLTVWIELAAADARDDKDSILHLLLSSDPSLPWKTREFRTTYLDHNPTTQKTATLYRELAESHCTDIQVVGRYAMLHRLMSALVYARIVRNDYMPTDVEWQERADKIPGPKLGDFSPNPEAS